MWFLANSRKFWTTKIWSYTVVVNVLYIIATNVADLSSNTNPFGKLHADEDSLLQ